MLGGRRPTCRIGEVPTPDRYSQKPTVPSGLVHRPLVQSDPSMQGIPIAPSLQTPSTAVDGAMHDQLDGQCASVEQAPSRQILSLSGRNPSLQTAPVRPVGHDPSSPQAGMV